MRTFQTLLAAAAGIYLLLSLLLFLFQNRMVFLAGLPGRTLTATPADAGFEYDDVSLTTSDGIRLHGWFIPAPDPSATLLFLHGNAGNISHRLDSIAIFRELGLDVLIIDYRGYGQSEGTPSEPGTYLDAQAAWDHLVATRGVSPARIVIFGRSLGAAVAAHLAAANPAAAAVILESCFTSALDMARRLYPFLPVRLLTRLEFPALDNVRRIRSSVLVVHSRDDEIIPFEMGQAIYAAAPEPKELLEITGDHNMGFLLNRDRYQAAIRAFIGEFVAR